MKYIKTYETDWTLSLYQKGDMVIIDSDWLDNMAEVIYVIPIGNFVNETEYKLHAKITKTYGHQEFTMIPVTDKDIIRKATQQEIDDYNLKNDIKKYNL